VTLGVAIATIVVIGSVVFYFARSRCPACAKRAVRAINWEDPWERDRRGIGVVAHYVCRACRCECRSVDGRTMISVGSYQSGVRVPLPKATARSTR
jgi:hypothetical protein